MDKDHNGVRVTKLTLILMIMLSLEKMAILNLMLLLIMILMLIPRLMLMQMTTLSLFRKRALGFLSPQHSYQRLQDRCPSHIA